MTTLPYDPSTIKRELSPCYISATEEDIEQMLRSVGVSELANLFDHIPSELQFSRPPSIGKRLSYGELAQHLEDISKKNNLWPSFLGDGLQHYRTHPIVPFVSSIRGLSTAYTPYQPERSQGTLHSLWVYASALKAVTGFEAINASFYDRSTALYEAFNTSLRIKKKKTILASAGLYPRDLQTVETHARATGMNIVRIPLDRHKGILEVSKVKEFLERHGDNVAAFSFPQVNHFGVIENTDSLTDLCHDYGILSIAVIDPLLNAPGGLKEASRWGRKGTTMFVGEGQHLALGPHYGGPGLGIFGIVFDKTFIRHTAGRFVGKTKDGEGKECFCMVLSTREQHIRRERATSNICSNQSFVATLVGASLLARGREGLAKTLTEARENALKAHALLTRYEGFDAAFHQPFFNEFTLKTDLPPKKLITEASQHRLHLGVDVSSRGGRNLLLTSCSDLQTSGDFKQLEKFLDHHFAKKPAPPPPPLEVRKEDMRKTEVLLPCFEQKEVENFYLFLGKQNVSPDDGPYPLGSCTMKYNPHINDWAASLPGFAGLHPQVPEEDAQGCLEILYHIQEIFKSITGLTATNLTAVAGAQGELMGLKMFQAYHRDRGEVRDTLFIPRSAHGTNPATAVMAGYKASNMMTLEAEGSGKVAMNHLNKLITSHGHRLAGIMITNPNTAGIFETEFKTISELVHSAGGLVYMDGANMNAIASWVDLKRLGVDAVHNNLHKTWTIPHGGGGPGDAVVCVSEKLLPYVPGIQIQKNSRGLYESFTAEKSIGPFHRHWGNFAHKVRAYTYLRALGSEGVRKMAAVAVLSSRYLYEKTKEMFPMLPDGASDTPRMHEFIMTLDKETFKNLQKIPLPKAQIIPLVGKLFLDFGIHAPTVAFPEQFGLMIEPTESYTKGELDRFLEILSAISRILKEAPEVLTTVPHFTPVCRVDEVQANKHLFLSESPVNLPSLPQSPLPPQSLQAMDIPQIYRKIIEAHGSRKSSAPP